MKNYHFQFLSKIILSSILLILVISPAEIFGTISKPTFSFTYGLDASYAQAKDKALVPFRWAGPQGLLLLGAEMKSRLYHSLLINCGFAYLENRYDDPGVDLILGAHYAVVDNDWLKIGEGKAGIGGVVEYQQRNFYYFSWDDAHLYWFNSLLAGPRFMYQMQIGSFNAFTSFDFALIGLVTRPERWKMQKQDAMTKATFYFTDTHRNAEFALPNKFQHIQFQAGVSKRLHKSSLSVSYKFVLDRYPNPAPVISLSHGLVVQQYFGGARK